MVDRFYKFAHFLPLSHPYTAVSIARLFFNHIFKLHGLPETIVSDWDVTFTSSFWTKLFYLSGTNYLLVQRTTLNLMAKLKWSTGLWRCASVVSLMSIRLNGWISYHRLNTIKIPLITLPYMLHISKWFMAARHLVYFLILLVVLSDIVDQALQKSRWHSQFHTGQFIEGTTENESFLW